MKPNLMLFIFICFLFSSSFIFTRESESSEIVIMLIMYDQERPYEESQIFQQQMEDDPPFPYVEVRDTMYNSVMARVRLHIDEPSVISLPGGSYLIDIWRSETWHVLLYGSEDQGIILDADHQSSEIRYDPRKYCYADAPRRIEEDFSEIPLLVGTHDTGEASLTIRIYDARTGFQVGNREIYVWENWHTVYFYPKYSFQLINNEAYIEIEFAGYVSYVGWIREYHYVYVKCPNHNLPKLPGWFAGDCHVHTEYTDNMAEFGIPVDAIWTGGTYFGLDFALCTDHSHDLDSTDWAQLGSYIGNHSGFWILRGEEISAYAQGNPLPRASHYLSYNISQLIYTGSWYNIYEYCDHQWVINAVNNQGGFGYIAHPFDPTYPWDNDNNDIDTFALEYTGMEIATYNLNNTAKNKWIDLLRQGRHVYAIGNSDAHSLCNVGAYGGYRTYVYCPQGLTQQNILDALKTGHSVVSQGPLLTFSINGIPPGGIVTTEQNTTLTLNIQGAVTPEWSDNGLIYLNLYYCTTDGSFTSEKRIYLGDFYAQPSGYTTIGFNGSLLQNQNGYIRLEGHSTHYGTEKTVFTNPIWIQIPPQFSEIPSLFALNSFHVVGDKAYCTDVLGTANVSWICGHKYMGRPEGRTDTILQESENSSGNLLITGGPAINPLAEEFGKVFGINYQYVENVSFTILCETQSLMLDLNQYPQRDIGIVYLGKQKERSILLTWGYGWQGTYAATVLMSHPDLWGVYESQHFLLLEWVDFDNDGLITWNEIHVVYPYHHNLPAPPPGTWYLDWPTFEYMPTLFGGNSIHVVGNFAYCTDVLGTANVSWICGRTYMGRPEGRTDWYLTPSEHDLANLFITGGPAVNPLAEEFGKTTYFNISYVYQPGNYFEISSDGYTYRLNLSEYPHKDICIIHLGRQNNRNVLLIWGYGWQGTCAGTLLAASPNFCSQYAGCHMLLLEWIDSNGDGLVQFNEIIVEYRASGSHIVS